MYQAAVRNNLHSAYQVAVTDYLKPPRIHFITIDGYNGAAGHQIEVDARDDFKVASVDLIIRDNSQQILEEGAATRFEELRNEWVYVTTKNLTIAPGYSIEARARDLPGNIGSKTLTL
jgi:hypothetical protein